MSVDPQAVVFGLTAPFGSGCTTAAEILKDRQSFEHCRLSSILLPVWQREHPERLPARSELQDLGNRVRKDNGDCAFLVRAAVEILAAKAEKLERIVFDGIRNTGEIQFLRERFGRRFFLIAIECPASDRWERLQHLYAREEDFGAENERDRNQEEDTYGQQVALCVDQADVLLENGNDVAQADFRSKLVEYADLLVGKRHRYATPAEILMNLAYSAAHGSKCLKRQVGAVVVAADPGHMGDIVGVGFNENPPPTKPCIEEPEYDADPAEGRPGVCYRDKVRYESFLELARLGRLCPVCGTAIAAPNAPKPPWRCQNCQSDFEEFFWVERAMSWCTAIHAEVASILAAGLRTRGATLYTTTFPCFQCAEKIAHAGIRCVVFTEPYPDVRAARRLQIAGITAVRFEGVRSRRFDEIFYGARGAVQRSA